MRRACACCALAIALLGSGCKAVRSMIDTQPEVRLSRQDYADPAKIVGGAAEVYLPPATPGWDGDDAALLHRCAPVILQGVPALGDTSCDPASDRIGTPRIARAADGLVASIDPAEPRVYETPTLVLLDAHGAEAKRLSGAIAVDALLAALQAAR